MPDQTTLEVEGAAKALLYSEEDLKTKLEEAVSIAVTSKVNSIATLLADSATLRLDGKFGAEKISQYLKDGKSPEYIEDLMKAVALETKAPEVNTSLGKKDADATLEEPSEKAKAMSGMLNFFSRKS